MAIQDINTLKDWFKRGLKPLQEQFWHWMDSFWHKDEQIPSASIEGLQDLLNEKITDAPLENGPYVRNGGIWIPFDSSNIPLKDMVAESLSEIAPNLAIALAEMKTAIITIRDQVRRLAGAAVTLNMGVSPQIIGLTETLLDFSTTYPSTNTDVIDTDDNNELIAIKINGRYQYATYVVFANPDTNQDANITLRTRSSDDAAGLITERVIEVPKNSVYIAPITNVPFDITDAPRNVYVTFQSDIANVQIVEFETTLTTSANTAILPGGGLTQLLYSNISEIKAITGYGDGNNAGDVTTGIFYEFSSASTATPDDIDVLLPDDIDVADPGRWVKKVKFVKGELPVFLSQFDGFNTSNPATGNWQLNNVINQGASTLIEMDITEHLSGADNTEWLNKLKTGSVVKAYNQEDRTQFIVATLNDDVIVSSGTAYLAVTINDNADIDDGAVCGWVFLSAGQKLTGTAKKILKYSDDGQTVEETSYDHDQVVQLADIDMSDISVGEKKIVLAEKDASGNPIMGGAIAQLDKLGPPTLDTLLAETQSGWDGDEITLTGNNLTGSLGENSQEYRIGSDFFLCISHVTGTDATNGSATWVRNRGQDALTPGVTHDDDIITELEVETGWSAANFKQIVNKSKKGTWYRNSTGGYLYMCIDKNNGWSRIGSPAVVDIEITTASHPTLTANLTAHDFATNGMYDESSDGTNEDAEQGQEWWDTSNNVWYKRNMDGYWAKMS